MSYWVELHCDVKAGRRPGEVWIFPPCETNSNNSPGAMSRSLGRAKKSLIEEALERGWRRFNGGQWACPYCFTRLLELRAEGSWPKKII